MRMMSASSYSLVVMPSSLASAKLTLRCDRRNSFAVFHAMGVMQPGLAFDNEPNVREGHEGVEKIVAAGLGLSTSSRTMGPTMV